MKKAMFFSLILAFVCNFAFADVIVLNTVPSNSDSTFLHDYGSLEIGNQYKTNNIFLSPTISSFQHIYEFNIPNLGVNVGSDPVNFIFFENGNTHIEKFFTGLFDNSNKELGSGTGFSVTNLIAGSYYIKISGIVDGTLGGMYNMDFSTTTPTPLPGAAILLGSGLLGLVGLRRREII